MSRTSRRPLTFAAVFSTPDYRIVTARSTGRVDLPRLGVVTVTIEAGRIVEALDSNGFELEPARVAAALEGAREAA